MDLEMTPQEALIAIVGYLATLVNTLALKITHSLTLAFATNATTITATVTDLVGTVGRIVFVVPALDGVTTATLSLKDTNGVVLWTSGACAASSKTAFDSTELLGLILAGTITVQIVTSGNQTANRVFGVDCYVQ